MNEDAMLRVADAFAFPCFALRHYPPNTSVCLTITADDNPSTMWAKVGDLLAARDLAARLRSAKANTLQQPDEYIKAAEYSTSYVKGETGRTSPREALIGTTDEDYEELLASEAAPSEAISTSEREEVLAVLEPFAHFTEARERAWRLMPDEGAFYGVKHPGCNLTFGDFRAVTRLVARLRSAPSEAEIPMKHKTLTPEEWAAERASLNAHLVKRAAPSPVPEDDDKHPGDEVMTRAAAMCREKCRARICERDGDCFASRAWNGPGFGWFSGYIKKAKAESPVAPAADSHSALSDKIAWAILQALHEDVSEAERPMSWSDMNEAQEKRIRAAANAAMSAFADSGFIQAVEELAVARSAPAAPVAWVFELGRSVTKGGEWTNWGPPELRFEAPNVPARSVRNLRPLYAHPAPAPDTAPPHGWEAAVEKIRAGLGDGGWGHGNSVEVEFGGIVLDAVSDALSELPALDTVAVPKETLKKWDDQLAFSVVRDYPSVINVRTEIVLLRGEQP